MEKKLWGEVTTPFMSRDPNKKNNMYLIEKMRQKDQVVAQQTEHKKTRGLFYKTDSKLRDGKPHKRQANTSLDRQDDIIWENREHSREDLLSKQQAALRVPGRHLHSKADPSKPPTPRRDLASRNAAGFAGSSREMTADSLQLLRNSGRHPATDASIKPQKTSTLSPAQIRSGGQLAVLLGQKKFSEMHNQLMVSVSTPHQEKSNYLNVCKKVRIEIRNEIMRRNMERTFDKIREQQIKQATPTKAASKPPPKSLNTSQQAKTKTADFRILGRSNVASEASVDPRLHLSCNLAPSFGSVQLEAGDPMREWNETVRRPRVRTFDGRAMSDYYYRMYMKEVHKVDLDHHELLRDLRGDQVIEDRLKPPVEAILARQKNLRRKYKFVLTRPKKKGPQLNTIDQVLAEMAKKELEEKRKAAAASDIYQVM